MRFSSGLHLNMDREVPDRLGVLEFNRVLCEEFLIDLGLSVLLYPLPPGGLKRSMVNSELHSVSGR